MRLHRVWDGIVVTVAPTFVFHVERVIELTPYRHTGASECPRIKSQLQDSLTRQHDLGVIHQLQTFRPKSLKKKQKTIGEFCAFHIQINHYLALKTVIEWKSAAWVAPHLQRLLFICRVFLSGDQLIHILPLHIWAAMEAHKGAWVRMNQWPEITVSGPHQYLTLVWMCTLLLLCFVEGVDPPLRKQCQAVGGQEMFHPISSSSDREDLVDTAEPHSLLFYRRRQHFRYYLVHLVFWMMTVHMRPYPAALTVTASRGRHTSGHGPSVGM